MTRIVLVSLIGAIALSLVVLELVRRRRLQERYSMLWLVTCLALIVLAAVPGLLNTISSALAASANPGQEAVDTSRHTRNFRALSP